MLTGPVHMSVCVRVRHFACTQRGPLGSCIHGDSWPHTLLRGCWTKATWLYHNLTLFNTLSSCHVFLCYALREKERVPTFISSYINLLPVKHRKRDLSAIFAIYWCGVPWTESRAITNDSIIWDRKRGWSGYLMPPFMMEHLEGVFSHTESEPWADDKGGGWSETNQSQSYMQSWVPWCPGDVVFWYFLIPSRFFSSWRGS